jgi:hypothetical protein
MENKSRTEATAESTNRARPDQYFNLSARSAHTLSKAAKQQGLSIASMFRKMIATFLNARGNVLLRASSKHLPCSVFASVDSAHMQSLQNVFEEHGVPFDCAGEIVVSIVAGDFLYVAPRQAAPRHCALTATLANQ